MCNVNNESDSDYLAPDDNDLRLDAYQEDQGDEEQDELTPDGSLTLVDDSSTDEYESEQEISLTTSFCASDNLADDADIEANAKDVSAYFSAQEAHDAAVNAKADADAGANNADANAPDVNSDKADVDANEDTDVIDEHLIENYLKDEQSLKKLHEIERLAALHPYCAAASHAKTYDELIEEARSNKLPTYELSEEEIEAFEQDPNANKSLEERILGTSDEVMEQHELDVEFNKQMAERSEQDLAFSSLLNRGSHGSNGSYCANGGFTPQSNVYQINKADLEKSLNKLALNAQNQTNNTQTLVKNNGASSGSSSSTGSSSTTSSYSPFLSPDRLSFDEAKDLAIRLGLQSADNYQFLGYVSLLQNCGSAFIDHLLDAKVNEIMINSTGDCFIDKYPEGMVKVGYYNNRVVENIIRALASLLKVEINKEDPHFSGKFPINGSRFEAILPPLSNNPTLVVRNHNCLDLSLADLTSSGMITQEQYDVLTKAVKEHLSILVAGETGCGKTTLINALLNQVSLLQPHERIVTIEDTSELKVKSHNHDNLFANKDGDLSNLVRSSLRLRPDRIIVGEVRGAEALDLIDALSSGHPGGMTTLHAGSALQALQRLTLMVSRHAQCPHDIEKLIGSTFDLVVHLRRDTHRHVDEMAYLRGYEHNSFQLEPVGTKATANKTQASTSAYQPRANTKMTKTDNFDNNSNYDVISERYPQLEPPVYDEEMMASLVNDPYQGDYAKAMENSEHILNLDHQYVDLLPAYDDEQELSYRASPNQNKAGNLVPPCESPAKESQSQAKDLDFSSLDQNSDFTMFNPPRKKGSKRSKENKPCELKAEPVSVLKPHPSLESLIGQYYDAIQGVAPENQGVIVHSFRDLIKKNVDPEELKGLQLSIFDERYDDKPNSSSKPTAGSNDGEATATKEKANKKPKTTSKASAATLNAPRKRGRPRKDASLAVAAPPRKRGRPSKAERMAREALSKTAASNTLKKCSSGKAEPRTVSFPEKMLGFKL